MGNLTQRFSIKGATQSRPISKRMAFGVEDARSWEFHFI